MPRSRSLRGEELGPSKLCAPSRQRGCLTTPFRENLVPSRLDAWRSARKIAGWVCEGEAV
jgi:hypothetical protein